jgi:hypothetical protein
MNRTRSRSCDDIYRKKDASDIVHINRDTEIRVSNIGLYYKSAGGESYVIKHVPFYPAPLWKIEEGILTNHFNYMKNPHDMYLVSLPRDEVKLERIRIKNNGWVFEYNTVDNTKTIITRGELWRDMEVLAKIIFDLDILIDRYNIDRLTGKPTDIYYRVKCYPTHSITEKDIASAFSIADDIHYWNDIL